MSRLLSIALISALLTLGGAVGVAWAQEAPKNPAAPKVLSIRMAVLDLNKILRDASSVKSVNKQLAGFRESFQSDVQKERTELRNADQELGRQRQILSPEAFAEERRKFEQKVRDAQIRADQRIRALERVRNEAMLKIQRALNAVVTEIARERGYAMILRSSQTVIVDSSLNVTSEVLKRIDEKLPEVTVNQPKPTPAPAPKQQ